MVDSIVTNTVWQIICPVLIEQEEATVLSNYCSTTLF